MAAAERSEQKRECLVILGSLGRGDEAGGGWLRACGLRIGQAPVSHSPCVAGEQTGANLRVIARAFRESLWPAASETSRYRVEAIGKSRLWSQRLSHGDESTSMRGFAGTRAAGCAARCHAAPWFYAV